ncbi:MAG: prolyl oligopeptidase family serine peptidase [Verrucomicrobiota bacterium]
MGAQDPAPIPRRLPPIGLEMPPPKRAAIEEEWQTLKERLGAEGNPDIELFSKAVRFALDHGEFYKEKDFELPGLLLAEAGRRLENPGWEKPKPGLHVRGYRSKIDGSVQPYGLEIPEAFVEGREAGLQRGQGWKGHPLWVWLHGRGDKETDMHFIHKRMTKPGQFQPADAIVLHPFGRQCVGWKWAGEWDVFEAIEDVGRHYEIDLGRIALMGFSMGGAGAWHIGAHYSDRFACIHPGAGFAETKAYNRLKPENYPPVYEQMLWGLYDVPNYARNFLNVPLIAYSGEKDKQIQAARVMERALVDHVRRHAGGRMGHVRDPGQLEQLRLHDRVNRGTLGRAWDDRIVDRRVGR